MLKIMWLLQSKNYNKTIQRKKNKQDLFKERKKSKL